MKRFSLILGLGLALSLPHLAVAGDDYEAKFKCLSANYKSPGSLPKLPGFAKLDKKTFVFVKPANRYKDSMDIYVYSPTGIYYFKKEAGGRERLEAPGASSFVVALNEHGDFMLVSNSTATGDRVRRLGANDLNKGGFGERVFEAQLGRALDSKALLGDIAAETETDKPNDRDKKMLAAYEGPGGFKEKIDACRDIPAAEDFVKAGDGVFADAQKQHQKQHNEHYARRSSHHSQRAKSVADREAVAADVK